MLFGILLAINILVCVALVGVILLQRSEGGALGMGGGGGGNFMTARGAGDLLTRTTQILAGTFFVLSLAMTIIGGRSHIGTSVADRLKIGPVDAAAVAKQKADALKQQQQDALSSAPAAAVPAPAVPVAAAPSPPSRPGPRALQLSIRWPASRSGRLSPLRLLRPPRPPLPRPIRRGAAFRAQA